MTHLIIAKDTDGNLRIGEYPTMPEFQSDMPETNLTFVAGSVVTDEFANALSDIVFKPQEA